MKLLHGLRTKAPAVPRKEVIRLHLTAYHMQYPQDETEGDVFDSPEWKKDQIKIVSCR